MEADRRFHRRKGGGVNVQQKVSAQIRPDRSGPEKHQKRRFLDGDRQSGRHGRHRRFVPDDVRLYGGADRRQPAARRLASHRPDRFICPAILSYPFAAVQGHLRAGVRRGQSHPPEPCGTAAQAALGLLRQAGFGRPHRDTHGRRQPHGARLEPCAGVSVRRIHLYGDHRRLPAYLRLAAVDCLPVGRAGGLWAAVRQPKDGCPRLRADEKSRCPGFRRHPGGAGKCAGDPRHQSGGTVSGRP